MPSQDQLNDLPSWVSPEALPPVGSRVVIGLSGGVDSAVTLALLKQWGCEPTAVFLHLISTPCAEQSLQDARQMADRFQTPFQVIEAQEAFSEAVLAPFARDYAEGRTPSPCCLCNPRVKFHLLAGAADRLGAEAVVTGHYARRFTQNHHPLLGPGACKERDQSYFLWGLSEQQLAQSYFPLGGASKDQVRAFAKTHDLPVFQKPDSQDLCFLQGAYSNYLDFLDDFAGKRGEKALKRALQPGPMVNTSGELVGQHHGIAHYTVGQRRGLGLASPTPLFVIQMTPERIVVGPKEALRVESVRLEGVHLHPAGTFLPTDSDVEVWVQYRSTMAPIPAFYQAKESRQAEIRFQEPQYGIARGQAMVFRNSEGILLGGGWILSTDTFSTTSSSISHEAEPS